MPLSHFRSLAAGRSAGLLRTAALLITAGLLSLLFGCSSGAVRGSEAPSISGKQSAVPEPASVTKDPISEQREALVRQMLANGDEWFGLYVLGRKTGVMSTGATRETRGGRDVLVVRQMMELQAAVGSRQVRRKVVGERVYDMAGQGRLLSLREEKTGDGGDGLLEGTFGDDGVVIVRTPKGGKPARRTVPPTAESLDAALAAAKVLEDGAPVTLAVFDTESRMADKRQTISLVKRQKMILAGVETEVAELSVAEEDSRMQQTLQVLPDGRVLEIRYGGVLLAKAEPEEQAKRHGSIEVFSSTRIVLGDGGGSQKLPEDFRQALRPVVYAVEGLPSAYCSVGDWQACKMSVDANGRPSASRAEVTVAPEKPAQRLALPLEKGFIESNGLSKWLEATPSVESDDPKVQALARQAAGGAADVFEASSNIAMFVYRFLAKSYGTSSDRSTRVIEQKKGDCTEHSLLFVALARASGIPARILSGLVYMDSGDGIPALYWHQWAEIYVGRWVPVDPTFGQPVADAGHIAFGTDGQNDVAALFGQLKIRVLRSVDAASP